VVGTVIDIVPNVSAAGPVDNDRSLSYATVVKGYKKSCGAALILLKFIDFNARDKVTLAKKKSFYRLVNNSVADLRQLRIPPRSR
jgi:hypothetical protein